MVKGIIFNDPQLSRIIVHSNGVELLTNDKNLKSQKLSSVLKLFKNLSFEVIYPSKSFAKVCDMISKLNREMNCRISLCVFITGIKRINSDFKNNRRIECANFDLSINYIGDDAFQDCSNL